MKKYFLVSELVVWLHHPHAANYVYHLHFTPFGISFLSFVTQPFAFLVLETINLGRN